jgi:hypothetical protein
MFPRPVGILWSNVNFIWDFINDFIRDFIWDFIRDYKIVFIDILTFQWKHSNFGIHRDFTRDFILE